MRIKISWALGFKVFTILYCVGVIGALILPSRESTEESSPNQPPAAQGPRPAGPPSSTPGSNSESSEPLTRAVLEGICFDIEGAIGQGEQLQVDVRAYNTGLDRGIVPGRVKGILRPPVFAAIFDDQGRRWPADQVRIGNIASTPGFLPVTRLIAGVPVTMVLSFQRMPANAGVLEIRTIPRLELPVVVGHDERDLETGREQPIVLVFRHIPVESR